MVRLVAIGSVLISVLISAAAGVASAQASDPPASIGHSGHGPAFDEGPRTKPWVIDGIGKSHFPITTANPEVQRWFDQGNTLLHSFWYFEAERSFRWCLKLEPDCAMAYWGLARCIAPWEVSPRRDEFIRQAAKRKHLVTERERRYIDLWDEVYLPELTGDFESGDADPDSRLEALASGLELIAIDYPEDDEAKALYVLCALWGPTRLGNEAVIADILSRNPDHPGAHHYRVHNWDGKEGGVALDSCAYYGRLAWASGHANHMPGHIYSGIGMWHEGAIWMDSATRVEKKYMEQRMTLPFHNWNYAHNRNYLSFIQEQLGMPTMAIDGARQLLAAPLDPEYNNPDGYGIYAQGMIAMVRALIKFERWEVILTEDAIPWRDNPPSKMTRAYAEALAHLGLGELDEAVESQIELHQVAAELAGDAPDNAPDNSSGPGADDLGDPLSRALAEVDARVMLARGDVLGGLGLLGRAAEAQYEHYRDENDPPHEAHLLYTVLGERHLDLGASRLAIECFEKSLDVCPNDAFALSGLARAQYAAGDIEGANRAFGRLRYVWSDAEPGLRWMDDALALGLNSPPIDDSPRAQRNYREQTLDELGPEVWRPYAAPTLSATDSAGKHVSLEEYRGKMVLLVFYLGEGCAHCVEQLHAIEERQSEFDARAVSVLAISSDTPEQHAASERMGALPFRLLSDSEHQNAHRFRAYDDFEEIELHSTILIDDQGRIRWSRTGGEPFMDFEFLVSEIDRVKNGLDAPSLAPPLASE